MVTSFDKALAAGIVGVAAAVLAHFGVQLPTDLELAVVGVVALALVYLVPNKE